MAATGFLNTPEERHIQATEGTRCNRAKDNRKQKEAQMIVRTSDQFEVVSYRLRVPIVQARRGRNWIPGYFGENKEILTHTHELNANWRRQSGGWELWALRLNAARPWTEKMTIEGAKGSVDVRQCTDFVGRQEDLDSISKLTKTSANIFATENGAF